MPQSLLVLGFTETTTIDRFLEIAKQRPHYVYDPAEDRGEQLFGWNHSSKSLRTPGGPERPQVYQLEVVGARDDEYSDVWWERLAGKVREIAAATDTPLRFPCSFNTPDTLGHDADWPEISGVIGRMHEPDAIHRSGDFTRLQRIINGPLSATSVEPEPIPVGRVEQWQEQLRLSGYTIDDPPGVFGPNTWNASQAIAARLYVTEIDLENAQQDLDELRASDSIEQRNSDALEALKAFGAAVRSAQGDTATG